MNSKKKPVFEKNFLKQYYITNKTTDHEKNNSDNNVDLRV